MLRQALPRGFFQNPTDVGFYELTPATPFDTGVVVAVEVPTANLNITELAPSIGFTINAVPDTRALTITGLVPDVVASENVVSSPGVGTLSVSGVAPSFFTSEGEPGSFAYYVSNRMSYIGSFVSDFTPFQARHYITVKPNRTVLAFIGQAPTVSASAADINIDVPATSVSISGFIPDVEAANPLQVSPPIDTLTFSGLAPSVSISDDISIDVPSAILALSGVAPNIEVSSNQAFEVPTVSLTIASYSPIPVVAAGVVSVAPATTTLLFAGHEPVIEGGTLRAERGNTTAKGVRIPSKRGRSRRVGGMRL